MSGNWKMTIAVLNRKKAFLINYLEDLQKFENVTFEEFMDNHYAIERLFELLVGVSCDIIFHLLNERGEETPTTYRTAFLRAGEIALLSNDLAQNLAKAAGMRNILVHGYDEIDFNQVYQSLRQAIKDFSLFLIEIEDAK
jgi:uncharacterized protein YutE (UPF0331/DUF86 family)